MPLYHIVFTKGILKSKTNKKQTKMKHNSNFVLSKLINKAIDNMILAPFGHRTYENHQHENEYASMRVQNEYYNKTDAQNTSVLL